MTFLKVHHSFCNRVVIDCEVMDLLLCEFTSSFCVLLVQMQRILFNDCLCDIAPGPDKVHISVDVLPKADRGSQLLSSFKLPSKFLIKYLWLLYGWREIWIAGLVYKYFYNVSI